MPSITIPPILSREVKTMANRICFVELPAAATAPAKAFYAAAFAFSMTDFGPTYACTLSGDVDLGIQADAGEATRAPLPVIQVESLEATLARVRGAGGVVTKPIFAFPGGRRFHFRDPSGNELAAMQAD
jgi:predicted enzyme related to lactoylglutathione lyase